MEMHSDGRRGLVRSFYPSVHHKSIWLRPEDEAPQRERKIVTFRNDADGRLELTRISLD
jgi:hypothetical protein